MNITLYSHEAFARFILYCILFGVAAGVLYCVNSAVFFVPAFWKCNSINEFRSTLSNISFIRSNVLDFLRVLIIAAALLAVSFIANSGRFRIISIPILLLGFRSGTLLFYRLIIKAVLLCFYLIKRVLAIIVFPLKISIRFLFRILKRIIIKIQDSRRAKRIAEYTKNSYNDFEKLKQTGLLEHWYEVV